jgi:HEAT repeat protein
MIDDKFMEEGDRIVPDLGEILLCEDSTELLTSAATMLGRIGSDRALSYLSGFLKQRDLKMLNSQFIASCVLGAIASSSNKTTPDVLRSVFLEGKTPEDRAEAMRLLANKSKGEKWFEERLQDIAGKEGEADIVRATAMRLLISWGREELAGAAMQSYFAMKSADARLQIIWAVSSIETPATKAFYEKVCLEESDRELLTEALPACYKRLKGEEGRLFKVLNAVYERQSQDEEISRIVATYLGRLGGKDVVALLDKMAAENGSQKVRDTAARSAAAAKKRAAGEDSNELKEKAEEKG